MAPKLSPNEAKMEQVIGEMERRMRHDAKLAKIDRILPPKLRRKKSSQDDPDLS